MLKKSLIFIIFLCRSALSDEPDPNIIKSRLNYLKFPDGKEIIISYHSNHMFEGDRKVRVFLRKGTQVLWDKTFSEEYKELWDRASFMPIIPKNYYLDLNQDSNYEVAVHVDSGGTAVWLSSALIFSVKNDELIFLKKQQVNSEFSPTVYTRIEDFHNPNFKCPVCTPKKYSCSEGVFAELGKCPGEK